MPVHTDMVDRIRRSLERTGPAQTDLAGLLSSWSVDVSDRDARRDLTDRLADAGIAVEPALEDVERTDAPVVLRLADPEALRRSRPQRVAAAASVAVPEPAAAEAPPRRGSLWARGAGRSEAVRAPAPEDVPDPIVRRAPSVEPEPNVAEATHADSDRWFDLERDLRRMHRPFLGIGAFLVIACLIMPWYSAQRDGNEVADLSIGWEWLKYLDVFLFVLGVAGAALLGVVLSRRRELSVWFARAMLVASGLAIVFTCYRSVKAPFDAINDYVVIVHPKAGPYVAVAGSTMLFLGALYVAGLTATIQQRFAALGRARVPSVTLPRRRDKRAGSDPT